MEPCLPKFQGDFSKEYQEALFSYFDYFIPKNLKKDKTIYQNIRKAYNLAFEAHKGVMRKAEKNPYIVHPVEVAKITIKEMGQGYEVIVSALLHDFIEDVDNELFPKPYDTLKDLFGVKIAEIVNGVSKVTKEGGKTEEIETTMKLIKSFIKYPEVILVKIADRLHNMRTMEGMPEKKQKIKSLENLKIYANFAYRIGLQDIKKELEDLSFKYLYKDIYLVIKKFYDFKFEIDKINYLVFLKEILDKAMKKKEIDFQIYYEFKSLYNIYEKLKKIHGQNPDKLLNEENLRKIHNYFSIRLILNVPDNKISHYADQIVKMFKKDLKTNQLFYAGNERDWLHKPKKNGFRARVFYIKFINRKFEIQIMTPKDHLIAKKGFAAITNLQDTLYNNIKETNSPYIILERLKDILQADEIYVKTPKGDEIRLPKGSYVLDFAYKIHTDLVIHFVGAKVYYDDKHYEVKSYKYQLQSGDTIEIITDENSINITPDWLQYARQSGTLKILKNYIKKQYPAQDQNQLTIITEFDPQKKFQITDDFFFEQASCCTPIPGDRSIMFKTLNETAILHKKNCKIAQKEINTGKKYAIVQWSISKKCTRRFKTYIYFEGVDTEGLLKQILDILVENNINMTNIFVYATHGGGVKGFAEIFVKNKSVLNNVFKKILSLKTVLKIERLNNFDFYSFRKQTENYELQNS